MGVKCLACNRRSGPSSRKPGRHYRCRVCWRYLRDQQEEEAARERLPKVMRAWLTGAPPCQVRTQHGRLDSADPAYRTDLISVLTVDDAVGDLGGAVNGAPLNHSCPDRLANGVPRGLRAEFDFVHLRFVNLEPRLPKGYSDVLMRERSYYPAPGSEPEMTFYAGSVFRSPGGDVVVRWRKLAHWPPGWAKHPAPLGS